MMCILKGLMEQLNEEKCGLREKRNNGNKSFYKVSFTHFLKSALTLNI